MHNSGRGAGQTGENRFSTASSTPGEAERAVTVQAPVLTLHFCPGSCPWFLTVSPCLLVPPSDLSAEKGWLTFSSLYVAKLAQPNLGVLQNQCSQYCWDTEPNTELLGFFMCTITKMNPATDQVPPEFKANSKVQPKVISLPFSCFSPQWKVSSCSFTKLLFLVHLPLY